MYAKGWKRAKDRYIPCNVTWYQSSVCTGGQSPCAQHDVQEDDTLQRLHAGRTEALKQTLRNGSQRKWVLQAPEYHRPLYRRSDTARRSSFHVAVRRWLRIVECQCHSNQLELLYYRPPRPTMSRKPSTTIPSVVR